MHKLYITDINEYENIWAAHTRDSTLLHSPVTPLCLSDPMSLTENTAPSSIPAGALMPSLP